MKTVFSGRPSCQEGSSLCDSLGSERVTGGGAKVRDPVVIKVWHLSGPAAS